MKIRLRFFAIMAALALVLAPAAALAQPVVPLLYHGNVQISGSAADIGTIVTAEISGVEVATNAPGGIAAAGSYSLDIVASEGNVVVLKVNGVVGGQATHPNPLAAFEVVLDLSVGEAPPSTLAAEAGGPYSGEEGASIALTGSATGGTSPYTYAWDLDNDGAYDDATGASPSYSWSTAGTYTIGLQVTDSDLDTDTDTATVTVTEAGAIDPWIYDTNPNDGIMSKDEAVAAITDYNDGAGTISKDDVLRVLILYFS